MEKSHAWAIPSGASRFARDYPVALQVSADGKLLSAVPNGANEREAAFRSLDAALADANARIKQLVPAHAMLPAGAPALHFAGPVYSELLLDAKASRVRVTSRSECGAAGCEIMRIDIGAPVEFGSTKATTLADGTTARFRPTVCGGSCTPAAIGYTRGGVNVTAQFETGFAAPKRQGLDAARDERLLMELANSTTR